MKCDRNKITKKSLSEEGIEAPIQASPGKLINMVWPLTKEVYSLNKKFNVKQRLQRHLVKLIKAPG